MGKMDKMGKMDRKLMAVFRSIMISLVMLAGVVGAESPGSQGEVRFEAGAARREITPREAVPMWGYGARHDALSVGTLDPLYADAVVMSIGGEKIALVGLDLGRSPSEASLQRIRQRILAAAGISHSLIAGSHSHHGPVLELSDETGKGKGRFDAAIRYYRELEDNIVGAILEADLRRVPAKLATGSAQLDGFNRNRHTKIEPKPSDRTLAVMRLTELNGKSIATIINYAAHPTMLPATTLRFSADYVGTLKSEVEKSLGGIAVFFNGAAGDQSVNPAKGRSPAEYGAALAGEVIRLTHELQPRTVSNPTLRVSEDRVRFSARTDFANPVVRSLYEKAFFPELIPNFIDEYADGVRPRLTVALLNGEIAIVGASGEFFSNHAIRLRERARLRDLFFLGYCNGYHQYFPTIEGVAEGGYGADNQVSPVAIGAGEELMNSALLSLYRMSGKIR